MGSPNTASLVVKIRRGLKRALVVPMLYVQACFTSLTFDDIFLDELSKFHHSYYITINQFTNRPPLPMSEKKNEGRWVSPLLRWMYATNDAAVRAVLSLADDFPNKWTDGQTAVSPHKKKNLLGTFFRSKKKKKRGGKGSFTIRHVIYYIPGIRT